MRDVGKEGGISGCNGRDAVVTIFLPEKQGNRIKMQLIEN